jgi:hypothetical protein
VLFNIAYLVGQAPPDTVFVKTSPVSPGDVLTITYELHINSEEVGGITVIVAGVPEQITPIEGDWYAWGEGYGSVLEDETALKPNIVALDESGLQCVLLSINLDDLAEDGDIPSKSGVLITYSLQVPADMEYGTYELTRVTDPQEGVFLLQYPFTGASKTPVPAFVADPIFVTDIPDYNALELPEITEVLSAGGTLSLPIQVLNKVEIASGSFKVSYPASVLTLDKVTAASRAGGAEFSIAETTTEDGVATSTIEFTGGSVSMGGLADLCTLDFSISGQTAGEAISISLADVALSDADGAAVADLQQPSVGTAEPDVFYSDTLFVGVEAGAHEVGVEDEGSGIAVIMDGQLHLPILLTNSVPVTVLDFYIQKVPADDAITLTLDEVMLTDRLTGWVLDETMIKDTVDYIHVLGYQNPTGDPIAAGSGELLTLVFDIGGWEGVITEDNPVDISLLLKGVEIVDADGNFLGVQKKDGIATIDYRVPLNGEGLGPGASLPKVFATSQNYPNPFNPSTTVNYQVPEDAGLVSFSLNVYDIRGKLVRTLAKGVKGPGYYTVNWDGTDNHGRYVSSGVYFYRFSSEKYTSTRKMVLLK